MTAAPREWNDEEAPTPMAPRPAKRQNSFQFGLIPAIIILVVAMGLSFWGGTAYQKSHTKTTAAASNQFNGRSGGFGGRFRGGAIGTVTAVSDSSISVQNERTGTTTTYTITSSTTVTSSGASATVSDIQTGDRVLIQTSGNGSTTATNIDVNPSFGGGAGGQTSPSSGDNL